MNDNIWANEIGKTQVYDAQVRCAQKILDIFSKHAGPPLLVAQMQQGKTGVAICVIDQFIKNCKLRNLSNEIIYLINIADNDLKEQTSRRILTSGFYDEVKVLHHADLKKFTPKKVDRRLIVIDECHIALERSNQKKLKPFHEFLKSCGIKYGEPISTWENKNNYVLSVSATPYAHVIKSRIDSKSFEPVVLELTPDYYSLNRMHSDNRLKGSLSLVFDNNVTQFLIEKIDEFLMSCKLDGNGHMIVRAKGEAPEIIERFVHEHYPNIVVKIYDSKQGNISSLDTELGQELPKPFMAIIKGSLRAGKTLKTTKHIRMWIEPTTSKADTMCQVVGRCLGFSGETQHSKFNDKFPIYCNVTEITEAIDFYNEMYSNKHPDTIPSGIQSKSTIEKVNKYALHVDDLEKIPSIALEYQVVEKIKVGSAGGSKVTLNPGTNIARMILNGGHMAHTNIIHIDAPAIASDPTEQSEYDEAWEEITSNGWIGKYAYYIENTDDDVIVNFNGKISDTAILG